jgi:hypothetical protein
LNAEYTPIATLEPDKTYEQVFLIASIKFHEGMVTSQGKKWARVVLKDVSGEIGGAIWGYNEDLQEGGYARMIVSTHYYRGALEFQAQGFDVWEEETPVNKFDYVHGVGEHALVSFAGEVEDAIMSIDDAVYRDVMGNALHRLDLMQALKTSPYGLDGPMSYRGGLLVHITHSLRFAKVAMTQAKELDLPFSPSLVVAGCVLRNIGWHTTTLFQGDYLRPRDAYHMTGIYRASARYIDHLMLTTESDLQIEIPESKRQALENICNKRADIHTLEGMIVSCADNMADVLDFSVASLQKKTTGSWTDELFTGHL